MSFSFLAYILPFNQHYILVYGPDAPALGVPLLEPPVFLRPGYKLWAGPDYLLPHSAVNDIGQEFGEPEIYEWLETQGDLFPRSDVFGYLPLGTERGVVVKGLDLTQLAVFASAQPDSGPFVRVTLAVEARAVPDNLALTPTPCPVPQFERALPSYRLAPGVFGAVGAAILNQLLVSKKRGWTLTFDELDEMVGVD